MDGFDNIEKDLADPIQISKDIDRSLYYYPKSKCKSIICTDYFRRANKKIKVTHLIRTCNIIRHITGS